jgi:hypothetical protein
MAIVVRIGHSNVRSNLDVESGSNLGLGDSPHKVNCDELLS